MPKTKEEKDEYAKKYRKNNKEKIALGQKQHYLKNKEKIAISIKEYQLKNKEKISLSGKQYYLKNKEKISIQNKEYYNSPEGNKKIRIKNWKQKGIIDNDFSALYDYLIKETNCMICFEPYKSSNNICLDHDHSITDEPNVRYICCQYCNIYVVG